MKLPTFIIICIALIAVLFAGLGAILTAIAPECCPCASVPAATFSQRWGEFEHERGASGSIIIEVRPDRRQWL